MSSHAHSLADFYHQMGLLVRSNMPLPDGLREVGREVQKRGFKEAVEDVAARVDRGEKVSDAVAAHPTYFSPLHARLIGIGEDTGALSEMLFSVSRLTRFGHMLVTTLRDVVTYPLLTIHMALIVTLGLALIVVPEYAVVFDDLMMGMQLPALTYFVVSVGTFISDHREVVLTLYLLFAAFSVWLLLPTRPSHAVLLAVVNAMPGSWSMLRSMDSARICRVWSACLRRGLPMPDAMEMCSGVVQSSHTRRALRRAVDQVRSGTAPGQAVEGEPAFDRLLAMTFLHTPGAELADELSALAEVYEHRVMLSARAASAIWTATAIVLMSLVVACVVLAVFLPLISIISNLSG